MSRRTTGNKGSLAPSGNERATNLALAVWLVTIVLTAVFLLRWFGTPDWFGALRPVGIGLVALTPWLAPAAVLTAGHAAWCGGWVQRILAGGLAVAFVAWSFSDAASLFGGSDEVIVASDLRVATANIGTFNAEPLGLVDALLAEQPDVIFLQEVPRTVGDQLRAHAPLADYTQRIASSEGGGRLIFARVPLGDLRVERLAPASIAVATVDVGGLPVEIVNLHLAAPRREDDALDWERQLRTLSANVHQRTMPMILVGDFNATVHHAEFRLLTEKGLTNAHEAVGSGFGFSWGRGGVEIMRIDHALSTAEVEPTRIVQLDDLGSDHDALIVDYRRAPAP